MIFKYTISVPCLSNHESWQQIHKVTGAQSTVIYMSKFYRQNLVTNAHLEMGHYLKCHISRWNMVSQVWHAVTNPHLVARTFGLDIWIVGTVSVWRCCECEANSSEKFHKTANITSILKEADQSELISGGPVSEFLCMVGGNSDLCRLCQFLWDSAEPTTLSRNMRPDSSRRFPLVYMGVLVHQNRKRVVSGTQALELVSLLHLWSISTHFMKQ